MYHFLQKLISSLRPSSTIANLLQRVPPFVFYLFYVTYKTRRLERVPPFNFFSAQCKFFSENFYCLKRVLPSDFLIFCNRKYVHESQRVPLFIFRHYATFSKLFSKKTSKKNFFIKIFKIFLFPVGKSDFPVISSMKGTLWVSRKCF